ncbi:hypothetical protein JHU38_05835 [Prevotella sp. A2931]|uniref:Uncharacterized protein n=1 Tax=Prevotella illustrans TaxID=2800387 RepID=A0ABS3M595_9BACT|nr:MULTISPECIES: hypothetical protein [Prevotella]MBO1363295.1 hypothetical protein [Prevotella illustrans]PTL25833.1 hypothetical protein C3V39_01320 [Prevotella sp. oral taxon 820]
MKKDLENLERFGGFIRLTTHQLVSAQPTVGVCLSAQKSYKSGQIEQINIDEKGFGEFGKIWRIYSPDDSSTRLGAADWKECPADRNLTNRDKSNK